MCDSVAATEAVDHWDSWSDQRNRQAAEAGSLRPIPAQAHECGGSSMAAILEVQDSQGQGQQHVVQPASTPITASSLRKPRTESEVLVQHLTAPHRSVRSGTPRWAATLRT